MNSTVKNPADINTKNEDNVLLIIDDEIQVLNTLRRIFDRLYTVKIANNTKDAFDIVAKMDVQVILCDQRMPDMKGTDFFASIKETHNDNIRILITGFSSLDDVVVAINEGDVFRYLTKPWNLFELKRSVQQAFDQNHLVRDNRRMIEELKDVNKLLEEKVDERTQEILSKNKELEKLNQKLELLAIQDGLTGLHNTRTLQAVFDERKKLIERLDLKMTLVMIDLNDFKKVNDQLGHVAGDELLIKFSSIAKTHTREGFDAVFRVGGDEFLMLLLNCNEASAHKVINTIDAEFKKCTEISSLAHGVVEIDPKVDTTLKQWIHLADERMYLNKKGNRGD